VSTAPTHRVLVCATGFPRSVDDAHKPFLLDHARALVDAGHEVTVVCPGAAGLPGREVIDGVDVVRFRYAPRVLETLAYDGAMYRRVVGPHVVVVPLFVLSFLATVVFAARRRRVDVIHAHWWAPTGIVAVVAATLTGAASVIHLHGSDATIARGPLVPLARWTLGRAGAVLAVSDELAAWGSAVSGRPVEVVPMPLPLGRLPVPTPPPDHGPVLGVGRLLPEKGFDVLIRAVAQVGRPVVLVGEGPERTALQVLAVEVGADLTLVGQVAPGELGEWYRRASVVAVPSRREGFGLVAAEAAAAGRAVVGTRVGGIPGVVDDGVSGILVPPDDVAALADALTRVDSAMGSRGPAQVEHLGPARHALAVGAAYERALSRRGDPAGR